MLFRTICLFAAFFFFAHGHAFADEAESNWLKNLGLPFLSGPSKQELETSTRITELCAAIRAEAAKLNWKLEPCEGLNWREGGISVEGRPLVYLEFGDPLSQNTTLVFSTVHGDEITPLYLGIQLAHWLKEHQSQLIKTRVVLAPVVNPDSFLRSPKTRVNARGVDVNRNFATNDWNDRALKAWKIRFKSDPRRFPGAQPHSEPETLFQADLIKRVRPHKILSIHAPLNFLDYDGPTVLSLKRFPRQYVRECLRLRSRLKATSSGFFPGSLGNYAGQELGIPTLTLELPSANPAKAEAYWKQFSTGIKTMIEFTVPNYASLSLQK